MVKGWSRGVKGIWQKASALEKGQHRVDAKRFCERLGALWADVVGNEAENKRKSENLVKGRSGDGQGTVRGWSRV